MSYLVMYLSALVELLTEQDPTPDDMASLFWEINSGVFEWSFHDEDEYGIKMAAYAQHGAPSLAMRVLGSS